MCFTLDKFSSPVFISASISDTVIKELCEVYTADWETKEGISVRGIVGSFLLYVENGDGADIARTIVGHLEVISQVYRCSKQ